MAVVVNHYSASASEIVAACLQDHHRAKIVGQRTWGKGTVQNLIDMEGGKSMLKLTTASYWRPSGVNIHRKKDAKESDEWGVRPDKGFEVTLTEEQAKQLALQRRERDVAAGKGAKPGPATPVDPPATKPAPQPSAEIHLPDVDLLPEETSPKAKPTGPIDDPQMRKAIQYLESELGQTGVG
jgi:carboxyl-terminal processing protease